MEALVEPVPEALADTPCRDAAALPLAAPSPCAVIIGEELLAALAVLPLSLIAPASGPPATGNGASFPAEASAGGAVVPLLFNNVGACACG